MHRILIVTSGPLCENPRPFKEALTLSHSGYAVTVLSVRPGAAVDPAERAMLAGVPFQQKTVDLIAGFGDSRLAVWARRNRLRIARQVTVRSGIGLPGSLGPASSLLKHARSICADLTIVHNEAPHWVGTQLIRDGRRVAADIEDWHSEDLTIEARRHRPLTLLRKNESTLLRTAAYCSTTSNALADALYARYGGRRPVVITNSFPLQEHARRRPQPKPSLIWFSQTIGPGRGLESFLASWALTRQPMRLVLVGADSHRFTESALRLLPITKRSEVTIIPTVAPEQLPSLLAQHDLGLALETSSIPSRDLTITNKILQYLNAGLGVVATSTAGQREVLRQAPDAGMLVDLSEPGAVAAALDELISDRTRVAAMGQAARQAAEDKFCWEREAPHLLEAVGHALETR